VTINYPPEVDGGCQRSLLTGITEIVPPNMAACENALKSCSTDDETTLNNRVSCANDAGMNTPACVAGEEQNWVSTVDTALGTCISQNMVTASCQAALNVAVTDGGA
jgi:hypothetical protein